MVARVLNACRGVLIVVALVAGCQRRSTLYCDKHPNDLANCPIADSSQSDAPIGCGSDGDCPAKFPHCLAMVCVECLDSSECTAANKMICDPTTHACEGCAQHTDCSSAACLPNGTCGDDNDVIYVAQGGTDAGICSFADPCATLTFALGLVKPARPFIKVSGAITDTVTITSKTVTILADPGAKLIATPTKTALTITMASDVTIYDLDIVGDSGQTALSAAASTVLLDRVTVEKAKLGIDFKGAATLFVEQSKIVGNPGGGLQTDMNATFNITNSVIAGNGTAASALGGASFGALTASSNRFELNTVADNQAKIGGMTVTAGVQCAASNMLDASNNLITHDTPTGATATPDTFGCNFTSSKVATDETPFLFVNPAIYNYHLQPGSTAIDAAPGDPTITDDIDGDHRPQGGGYDYGADEYKP